MLIVHVHVHVKSEYVESFKTATIENATKSLLEPGIARFDVIQQADDPSRFVLVEVYRNNDAPSEHKQTTHYEIWRSSVQDMMLEPRSSMKFCAIFPVDADW